MTSTSGLRLSERTEREALESEIAHCQKMIMHYANDFTIHGWGEFRLWDDKRKTAQTRLEALNKREKGI